MNELTFSDRIKLKTSYHNWLAEMHKCDMIDKCVQPTELGLLAYLQMNECFNVEAVKELIKKVAIV